jgi:hypothetical protein
MKAAVIIGVVGGGDAAPEVEALAEATGRAIAEAGAVLICGGLGGVMAAACRGAAEAGGLTLGVLPGVDRAGANPWVAVPIVTGLAQARNVIIARTADALIAIDGCYGTLSEIAFALHFGTPVIGLSTWDLGLDPDPIARAGSPAEAVRWALQAAAASPGCS